MFARKIKRINSNTIKSDSKDTRLEDVPILHCTYSFTPLCVICVSCATDVIGEVFSENFCVWTTRTVCYNVWTEKSHVMAHIDCGQDRLLGALQDVFSPFSRVITLRGKRKARRSTIITTLVVRRRRKFKSISIQRSPLIPLFWSFKYKNSSTN